MEFLAANLAPLMFAVFVAVLLSGYPVAFGLIGIGVVFFIIGVELAQYAPDIIRLDWVLLQALPGRIVGVFSNEVLLAIPFFTFMGIVLERSGLAEDLLDAAAHIFGTLRGGLAYAVIFVGVLLAATTGILSASVIAMGMISLPVMMRYGYDNRHACGVIAASGTLSLIMPPSIVLIIIADQVGRSVGGMYLAAFVPALGLAAMYLIWIVFLSWFRPTGLPGLPAEDIRYREEDGSRGLLQLASLISSSVVYSILVLYRTGMSMGPDFVILSLCGALAGCFVAVSVNKVINRWAWGRWAIVPVIFATFYGSIGGLGTMSTTLCSYALFGVGFAFLGQIIKGKNSRGIIPAMVEASIFSMVPPLFLMFLVLGTIFVGLATPTEAGAMGAVGALLVAGLARYTTGNIRRFNWRMIKDATVATARLVVFVFVLLIGATTFSLTFYGINGHIWVEGVLSGIPGGELGFLLFTFGAVFLLGFFLDFFELVFVVVPLLIPTAIGLEIDMILFGIILAVTLQTSFLTPPFGFALIYLRSVAPLSVKKDGGVSAEGVKTAEIYQGVIPFVVIQVVMVLLVILFPGIIVGNISTGAISEEEVLRLLRNIGP